MFFPSLSTVMLAGSFLSKNCRGECCFVFEEGLKEIEEGLKESLAEELGSNLLFPI